MYHGFIAVPFVAASCKAAGTFAANVIYRLKKMADFRNPFNQVGKIKVEGSRNQMTLEETCNFKN